MIQRPLLPPKDQDELLDRALSLVGKRLGDVALALGYRTPESLRRNKGFIGQITELALGANAQNEALPDFKQLGIELKTLPIKAPNEPLEATYISLARLHEVEPLELKESHLFQKLARILFVPILEHECLKDRMFLMPILWSPSKDELTTLSADYRQLQSRIQLGQSDDISTKEGRALHLRPKAMHGSVRSSGISSEGWRIPVKPKGWYLRREFTRSILEKHFG